MKHVLSDTTNHFLKTVNVLVIPLTAGAVKHLLLEKKTTLYSFMSDMAIAGFGGYMAHLLLLDITMLSDGAKSVVIGMIALSADVLLKGVLRLSVKFVENPKKVLQDIKDIRK